MTILWRILNRLDRNRASLIILYGCDEEILWEPSSYVCELLERSLSEIGEAIPTSIELECLAACGYFTNSEVLDFFRIFLRGL